MKDGVPVEGKVEGCLHEPIMDFLKNIHSLIQEKPRLKQAFKDAGMDFFEEGEEENKKVCEIEEKGNFENLKSFFKKFVEEVKPSSQNYRMNYSIQKAMQAHEESPERSKIVLAALKKLFVKYNKELMGFLEDFSISDEENMEDLEAMEWRQLDKDKFKEMGLNCF